jgi:hypothetical protein
MARQNIRLVSYAWGRHYLDDLLDFALSGALAPGNLPALAAVFDCTAVIVTEERLFHYIRAHPTIKKLEQVCPVSLVPLDDLLSDPWQYGMTLAYALFRGFSDLGPAMTDTYILFLNADFILADGCYARLIDHIRSAERVHLAPSYCTVDEQMRPLLRDIKKESAGILAIPPRNMAALILAHPHNTIRAKTINQSIFEFEYADQFYWKVDSHTLIGHQMPIALIGMRPERELTDLNTFWDWGIVYEFCPSKQLTVIGDSDDFLIMELRAKDRSMESISFGRSAPRQVARRLRGHITQYQLDNARFELLLHSHELPSNLTDARRQLRAHVDEVLRYLPTVPSYRRHRQWIYHLRHFRQRLDRKSIHSRMSRVRSEIERAQRDLGRERELIDEYLSNEDREQALQYLETEYDGTLQTLLGELARLETQLQTSIRLVERIYRRIAGVPWAYRVSRRRLRSWIQQAADSGTLRILAVSLAHSLLLELLEPVSGLHMHLTPESVAKGALGRLPKAGPDFDVCLVELIDLEVPRAREMLDTVAGRLKKPGTILVHWHDQGSVPLRSVHNQIVQFALDRGCHVNAHYAGSWASAQAAKAFHRLKNTPKWRQVMPLVSFGAFSVFAELRERLRKKQLTRIPKYASSAAFQIEMLSREVLHSIAAQIDSKPQKATLIKALPRARKAHPAARPSNRQPVGIAGFSEEPAGNKQ